MPYITLIINDNYVRAGKIPKGRKQQGFKELFFYKKDLDKFKENN